MYTLLYGFYKYMVQKDEFCVLILGLDNAGKTVSSLLLANMVCLQFQFLDLPGVCKN